MIVHHNVSVVLIGKLPNVQYSGVIINASSYRSTTSSPTATRIALRTTILTTI